MTLADFSAQLAFPLDEYQIKACQQLEAGAGVLVAAPTGAGKTVVGEFAVHLAAQAGTKCFYTTPIKALSNQKFHDLVGVYGPARVGLLTGDSVVNGEAPIVVMTTEVLRNMLYAGSPTLAGLEFVVLDEVHYLADRFRGPVWEEVILGLDPGVKLVGLSATVSNVEEFGAWLASVRPNIATIVSEERPIPLYQHVFAGKRLLDLFDQRPTSAPGGPAKVNPELLRLAGDESRLMRDDSRRLRGRSGAGRRSSQFALGQQPHQRWAARSPLVPRRASVVAELQRLDLLPAIFFIFSRQGCDQAVARLVDDDVWLTKRGEQAALREIAQRHISGLASEDLEALRHRRWLEAFVRGIAAHHAGLLPMFKQAVEEAFSAGLIKVVFATETLALGINMPARTVVLEKLSKYNGVSHADITPGEYTQLTGRAGRRGIDVEGHAVVSWQSGLDPRAVAGLASRRTYPLRSAFTPTYNMAINLLSTMSQKRAKQLLEASFAQFQIGASTTPTKRRVGALVAKFEAVCLILEALGYLAGSPSVVTPTGLTLSRLYGPHDLLIAEAIRAGIFDQLSAPSLAATLSVLVYESRLTDRGTNPRLPDQASARAVIALRKLARELALLEHDHRLDPAPPLDLGFAYSAYAWADGASLAEIIEHTGMAAGDFVRWIRQCIDAASQIADAVPGSGLAAACHGLVRAMRRGVVDIDMTFE